MTRELDLDALVHRAPAARGGEFSRKLLQLRLRRPDDVAPTSLPKPCQILRTRHAAVGDPDAAQHAVPSLHRAHDGLQGARVVGVAGKHLVAQRKAVKGHHQRDADLLAVRAVIPGVAALRQRIGFGLALKVGARDVVQQHFVLHGKQFAAALRQMHLQRRLVRKQMIERAIKSILVDLLIAKLQQIAKRRATIPILGNVQLARRFT